MINVGLPELLLLGVVLMAALRKPLKIEQRLPMIPWKLVTTFVAGLVTGFEAIRLFGDGWFGTAIVLGIISFAELYGSVRYRKERKQKSSGSKKNGCASLTINVIYAVLALSALQFVSAGLLVHAIWTGTYCALGLRGKVSDLWKERKQKSK